MPIFKRPDGERIRNESLVRRFMPYLMRGRNESCIYHEQTWNIARTRTWVKAYNKSHRENPATLFHVFLWSCARALWDRPGLNRFVSGGELYQRKGVQISFAAKKEIRDEAPLVTVKMDFPQTDRFDAFVARLVAAIDNGRTGPAGMVDKELKLALALPGWLLRLVLWALARLDWWNLMPKAMIDSDPMYTSLFVANLGSVGLDNTFHHLYEYGTCSLFGVLGPPRRTNVLDARGKVVVEESMQTRWTLDERVNDGMHCAYSLKRGQALFEDPYTSIGDPETLLPVQPVASAALTGS